jgi:dTDP-glucose 4,6-dehydratase
MQTVLITGGAGFIGSNFVLYFLANHPDWRIVNLDKLTYAADLKNLVQADEYKNYNFVEGDICDDKFVADLFQKYDIRSVIHLAAESHVDNSITGPRAFVETNINGTFALLEAARSHWFTAPKTPKLGYENCRFLHVSTDEVYGTLGDDDLFTEQTAYAPNSPYSASKAASDMLVRSYHHTYGLHTVITNCSNNYGQHQHNEKLIPTIIRKAVSLQPIPIYGNGKNIRDWLYVTDHCSGIAVAFAKGVSGETYNIGGENERQNIDIAHIIATILDEKQPRTDDKSYRDLITFVNDRPGHDFRYAIDATKIKTQLGWLPAETFETGIKKTIDWYLAKYEI